MTRIGLTSGVEKEEANMSSYLMHYGTKGQKWGDRKYQYEDGSLTPEGKIHYGVGQGKKYSGKPSYGYKKKPYKSTVIIKPGQKKGVVKTALNQTRKDFNRDMKSSKTSPKSIFKKANDFFSTPGGKAILGIGVSLITAAGTTVVKNIVNKNMKDTTIHEVKFNPNTVSSAISKGQALYSAYGNLHTNSSEFSGDSFMFKKK